MKLLTTFVDANPNDSPKQTSRENEEIPKVFIFFLSFFMFIIFRLTLWIPYLNLFFLSLINLSFFYQEAVNSITVDLGTTNPPEQPIYSSPILQQASILQEHEKVDNPDVQHEID